MKRSCIVGLLLLVTAGSAGQPCPSSTRLLDIRVERFEFHGKSLTRAHVVRNDLGDMAEAARSLASHARVRICTEQVPLPLRENVAVDITARNQTVGQILQALSRQDGRYEFRERLGVIEVLPRGAENDPSSCLNMKVPVLSVHYPWRNAWGAVRCAIELLSKRPEDYTEDPLAHCLSFSALHHPPEKVLNKRFVNTSVREILDCLAADAGNAAWSAEFKDTGRTCDSLMLGEYQPDHWRYVPDNESRQCFSCHYHRR